MKKYKSHKIVEAGKIVELSTNGMDDTILELEGGERKYVRPPYMQKHAPYRGGYYVRYADGYESYSPRTVFEAGYTEVTE